MTMTLDGTNGVTFNDTSLQGAAASPYVLKNRIINGDMGIDQRNAGASVTPINLEYTVDRWAAGLTQASKFSVQQNAAAVTPPVGFSNYLGVTSLSSYSVLAGDIFLIRQYIEGYNFADLGWGTANAKTITLSFWVRSSLTGTFGGSLMNSASNRSYPFTYSISVANTWEQKTITVAGDTSGTWIGATNGIGVRVFFGLGGGATYSGTAGAWAASAFYTATGATSVVGTNGATFYITGVQLEQNTVATPFERRLYNQELANCQRYYEQIGNFVGRASAATGAEGSISILVTKRATPTMTIINGTSTLLEVAVATRSFTTIAASNVQVNGGYISLTGSTGLTSPNLCTFFNNAAILAASSEL